MVVDARNLSYEAFTREYMQRNEPCLLTHVVDTWKLLGECTDVLKHLSSSFGHAKVPVLHASKHSNRTKDTITAYGEESCSMMDLKQFIDSWQEEGTEIAYLKDWHFLRDFPEEFSKLYHVPKFFQDDWLNAWCDSVSTLGAGETADNGDDFRFLYLGPEGSYTSLHHDVFFSYSW